MTTVKTVLVVPVEGYTKDTVGLDALFKSVDYYVEDFYIPDVKNAFLIHFPDWFNSNDAIVTGLALRCQTVFISPNVQDISKLRSLT